MRCPECNKFMSFDDSAEPELDLDTDGGEVNGSARIVLTCAECGTEMKDATFAVDIDLAGSIPEGYEIEDSEITTQSAEMTTRQQGRNVFYGCAIEVTIALKVKLEAEDPNEAPAELTSLTISKSWSDEIPASEMDELA